MPVHLSALGRTREEDRATVHGGVQGQLAKGEDLAPALRMQLWAQSTHLQFGHLLDTNIIGYSPHDHSCFALPARKLHLPDLGWAQGKGAVIYTLNKFPPALKSTHQSRHPKGQQLCLIWAKPTHATPL